MKFLNSMDKDFDFEFNKFVNRSNLDMDSVEAIVKNIINEVKINGDDALKEQILKFDKWEVKNNLKITQESMKKA